MNFSEYCQKNFEHCLVFVDAQYWYEATQYAGSRNIITVTRYNLDDGICRGSQSFTVNGFLKEFPNGHALIAKYMLQSMGEMLDWK